MRKHDFDNPDYHLYGQLIERRERLWDEAQTFRLAKLARGESKLRLRTRLGLQLVHWGLRLTGRYEHFVLDEAIAQLQSS